MYTYHIIFSHSSVVGHLGHFHILAINSNAEPSTCPHENSLKMSYLLVFFKPFYWKIIEYKKLCIFNEHKLKILEISIHPWHNLNNLYHKHIYYHPNFLTLFINTISVMMMMRGRSRVYMIRTQHKIYSLSTFKGT